MKRTIKNVNLFGKRVFLRVDFNVALNDDGTIADTTRVDLALPTIKFLLGHSAKLIICSHLGRPKGEVNQKYSLSVVADYLQSQIYGNVEFCSDVLAEETYQKSLDMKNGDVIVLENIRFYSEEEQNDLDFAKKLARLADFYVFDAFGTAHRKHASTYALSTLLPNAAGFLVGNEVNTISNILKNAEMPFVAVLGGSKVSDKLKIIKHLTNKCSSIVIGGAMAYTFLKARGFNIGKSLVEEDMIQECNIIEDLCKKNNAMLMLPIDHICAKEFDKESKPICIENQNIDDDLLGLDIGQKTAQLYADIISKSKTVFFNGTMGVFEWKNFANGTIAVANAIADSNAVSLIGGGDSVTAIKKLKLENYITHISTGGGASLKLVGGESLPCVEVIFDEEE